MLLYNTGAMATSCIYINAYNLGYQFVWNRCDAKNGYFKGGGLFYYGPQVRAIDSGDIPQLYIILGYMLKKSIAITLSLT